MKYLLTMELRNPFTQELHDHIEFRIKSPPVGKFEWNPSDRWSIEEDRVIVVKIEILDPEGSEETPERNVPALLEEASKDDDGV